MRRTVKCLIGSTVALIAAGSGLIASSTRTLTSTSRQLRWVDGLDILSDAEGQWLLAPPGGIAEHPGRLTLHTTEAGQILHLGPPEKRPDHGGPTRKIEAGDPQPVIDTQRGAFTGHLGQTPDDLGVDYTEATIGACDVWQVPASTAETGIWAIHLHGLGSSRSQTLRSLPTLATYGVTSLVPTTPLSSTYRHRLPRRRIAHQSVEDLHKVHRYALSQGATGVIYVGWSMAAAVVLHQAQKEVTGEVAGVMLISPVLDLPGLVRAVVTRCSHKVVAIALAAIILRLSGWGHIASSVKRERRKANRLPVPALMVCAEEDQQIPISLTCRSARADYPNAQVVTVPRAHHTLEWNADPELVAQEVSQWIQELIADRHGGHDKGARP